MRNICMFKENPVLFEDFKGFFELSGLKIFYKFLSFLLILFVHVLRSVVPCLYVGYRQFDRSCTFVLNLSLFFCQYFFLSDTIRLNYRYFTRTFLWNYWFVIIHVHVFCSLKYFKYCSWLLSISDIIPSICWALFFQISLYDVFRIWRVVLTNGIKLWAFLLLRMFTCLVFFPHLMKPFQVIWIHSQGIQQIMSFNGMANRKVFGKGFKLSWPSKDKSSMAKGILVKIMIGLFC